MNTARVADLLEDLAERLEVAQAPDPIGLAEDLADMVAQHWDRAMLDYRNALRDQGADQPGHAHTPPAVLRPHTDPSGGLRLDPPARPLPGQIVALDLRTVRPAVPADLADVLAAVLPACLDAAEVRLWGRGSVTRPLARVLRTVLTCRVHVTAAHAEPARRPGEPRGGRRG